ncbi:MAG TPA: hypothetical protein PKA82_06155 [Pyrinomonadaceae bacterium]|nr:hypothetical protein [Pyrinomonadaceae bacterium]
MNSGRHRPSSRQTSITILTKLDDTYNWGRILDFSDGGNNGVYVNVDTLYFVGAGVQASAPAVHGGVWVELKFTRTAAGIFTAYVNGVQQFSFNDTGGLSIIGPTNALRFFKDDLHEHDSGAIARIQLSPGDGCSGGGQCVTAPANNVAWYRGNNNPLDFGSNPPMHASMENGATFALGKVGNGFSFDGVNDFVSAPDDNKFDITGDLSIESWVRPAQIQPGEVTLVSKRDTANSNVNYVLYLQNGQLMFASRSNGGGFTVNASGITLSPATFSHVAVTIESGTLKFYVNGVPTAPQTTAASRSASTGRLTIGAYETTSAGDFFIGVIDELAIYSRALTAGEILSIFNADSAGKCVSGGNTTTYSIGGRVTDHNGAGLGNVPVGLSDGPTTFGSISTDANGYYLWYNLQANSNYTVTPTLANTTFTPTSRSYTNITNNVADANFAANAPCTYTLDPPTSNIFPAAGGTGTFNVQTQPGCSWTATTNSNASSWVTFNGPTTGTGNGTVNYTVAANTSYIRVGDIMVNGTQYVLGQETGSGTCATVTPITYGTVINGALAGSDCNQSGRNTDQYSFSGTAGERIMIRLSSSDFAEALIVHNSANTTIFATATGGAATDARVPNSYGFYTLPVTGTYIISATNWGNGGSPTGNYTFTLHSDRTVPGVTPPAGLIGWYAGEADTRNQQGNSPGTFNGTATYATDYVGQSFNMNGTDRYVEVPSASEPFNVSSISVEAWVNTTTTAGNRTIASKFNGSGGASWSLDMEAGGAMIFTVYDGTTANFRASRTVGSAAFLTANEWKHVAATFDHTTQAIALYVNGANAGDLVAGSSPNIGGIGQNSVPVRISAKFNGSMQGFWSGRLDEISIYNRAITHEEVESIIDAGRIGKIKTAAINNQTSVSLGTSTINFAVATTGSATETPIDAGALPAPLPMGQSLHLAFNISTNAPFTGMATVCFAVPTVTPTEFATLKVYHLEGGVWVDRTAPGNVYPTLCANTPSFSPFAIAKPLGPSSSNVTVGGRVLTDSGQGIKNTHVSLSLADGTVLRTRSSSFGYYRFDNIESGQTGILSVHSKRFVFAQPNRVITISDDLNDLDFIAEP